MQRLLNWLIETWSMPWFSNALGIRSKEHNKVLEAIMKNNLVPDSVSPIDLTATFGDISIWLGNYPYAFGYVYAYHQVGRRLPTLRTAYRFKQYIDTIILEDTLRRLNEKTSNYTSN